MNKETVLSSLGILPKEEMLEVKRDFKQLLIGVPKESSFQENRISLTPDSVGLLIDSGHSVIVENNAGEASNFSNQEYIDKGAEIVFSKNEVYKANIIVKIEPPTSKEISLMHNNQKLISAVQINTQSKEFFNKLNKKNITSFGYEFIKDNHNKLPFVRIMSEIAGNTSMLIAGEYLSNINQGKGLMLGGISGLIPTNVVVIGAGTVGEFACKSSLGLGASVIVFDNSITKLRRLQNNVKNIVSTSTLQPKVLLKALKRADVVIAALQIGNGRVPCVVTEEMVKEMKKGSVVIDVSIDQGGCFETSEVTSHKNPVFTKYDVIHYCVPNIASRVSRTASLAISNIITPILLTIAEEGGVRNTIRNNPSLRNGVYTYNSNLTNTILSKQFNIPYVNLDLII
ncbi:MAG: alanine dehydrogenase [Flavobacteriales bacterium]|nr:alanine dehydrogenase [Flavobacteriales bacterium]MBH70752.1 alanine dehydrogenase [Flavobacteriales bacterium]MBO97608.1 alanine dehydrogenase [Flavobacteriales bacterium]|tara:strand:- start:825 stop:2021 length:1197 start_codon:yes stop_codon:yes gene_type:complete